jgi:hypothetical protein
VTGVKLDILSVETWKASCIMIVANVSGQLIFSPLDAGQPPDSLDPMVLLWIKKQAT